MKLKAGHVAATQQYVRNEGAALVRALPQGSRDNLHYFETVSVLHAFNPLPPLRGKALSQRAFYHLVLTDWSLFVVARNPGNEGGVEVEIPLLAIKDMDMETVDSDHFLQPIEGKRVKTMVISIYPQVDAQQLPPAQRDKVARVQKVLNAGGDTAAAYAAAKDTGGCCGGGNATAAQDPKAAAAPGANGAQQGGPPLPQQQGPQQQGMYPPGFIPPGAPGQQPMQPQYAMQQQVPPHASPQQYPQQQSPYGSPQPQYAQQQQQQQLGSPQGQYQGQQQQSSPYASPRPQFQVLSPQQQASPYASPPPQYQGQQPPSYGSPRPQNQALAPQQQASPYASPQGQYQAMAQQQQQQQSPYGSPRPQYTQASPYASPQGAPLPGQAMAYAQPPISQTHVQQQQPLQQGLARQGPGPVGEAVEGPLLLSPNPPPPHTYSPQTPPQWSPGQAAQDPFKVADVLLQQQATTVPVGSPRPPHDYQRPSPRMPQWQPGAAVPNPFFRQPLVQQLPFWPPGSPPPPAHPMRPHGNPLRPYVPPQQQQQQQQQAGPQAPGAQSPQGMLPGGMRPQGQAGFGSPRPMMQLQQQPTSGLLQAFNSPPQLFPPGAAAGTGLSPGQVGPSAARPRRRSHAPAPSAMLVAPAPEWDGEGPEPGGVRDYPLYLEPLPPPPPLDLRAPILWPSDQPYPPDAPWEPEPQPEDAVDFVLPDYRLVVLTVEPRTALWHHLRRAWLGAHMRMNLALAGLPGTPLWWLPPSQPLLNHLRSPSKQAKGSRWAVSKETPQQAQARRVGVQQLLQYFGYGSLHNALQSARSAATPPAITTGHLFPGDSDGEDDAEAAGSGLVEYNFDQLHPDHHTTSTVWAGAAGPGSPQVPGAAAGPQQGPAQGMGGPHRGPGMLPSSSLTQKEAQHLSMLLAHSSAALGGGQSPAVAQAVRRQLLMHPQGQAALLQERAIDLVSQQWANPGDFSELQVRGAYEAAEEVMARGCSLFDDGDVAVMKELLLELSLCPGPKARGYSSCFFRSKATQAFILSRLYAWGTVCALYGPHKGRHKHHKKDQPGAGTSSSASSATAAAAGPPAAAGAPGATAPGSYQLRSSVSTADTGALAAGDAGGVTAGEGSGGAGRQGSEKKKSKGYVSPYVEWVLNKHKEKGDEWGELPPGTSEGAPLSPWSAALYKAAHADAGRKPWDSPGASPSPFSPGSPHPPKPWEGLPTPRGEGGGAAAGAGPSPRQGQGQGQGREGGPYTTTFHAQASPRDGKPSPAAAAGGNHGGASPAKAFPSLSVEVPAAGPGIPRGGGGAGGAGAGPHQEPHSHGPPSSRLSPGATLGNAGKSHRRPPLDPDYYTGAKKTSEEEQYEFFLELYNMRAWGALPLGASMPPSVAETGNLVGGDGEDNGVPLHPKHLLASLGLCKAAPTSINITLGAMMRAADLRHSALASAMKGGGPWPHRSKPPPVQAPPTLAPSDPLMLSPLKEEPYLFVLRDPEEALQEGVSLQGGSVGKAGAAGRVGGGTPVGSPYANAAASQALARQQARLQGKETGKALQDAWAEEWHGSADADELLVDMSPGMARWQRLVGRMCAALAWRKTRLLLFWVHSTLSHSEAVTGRLAWLSEEVVEEDSGAGAWTCERVTRNTVAALTQLRDPKVRSGRTPRPRGPASPFDMLWWARGEAGGPKAWLDHVVGIMWEVAGMSAQAAVDDESGMAPPNLLVEVIQALPRPVVHGFMHRALSRTLCLATGAAVSPELRAPSVLVADVTGFKYCELLLTLLSRLQGSAAELNDDLDSRLLHLLRTPEVRAALATRSFDTVLPRLFSNMLAAVVHMILAAGPASRPSAMWAPDLPQATVNSIGTKLHFSMPGATT